jgi:hypothetical protein
LLKVERSGCILLQIYVQGSLLDRSSIRIFFVLLIQAFLSGLLLPVVKLLVHDCCAGLFLLASSHTGQRVPATGWLQARELSGCSKI